MADLLQTTQGNGAQSTTQNPQQATQPTNTAAPASSVQPGVSNNINENSTATGIQLNATPLTTVSLAGTQSTSTTTQPVKEHHINPVLGGFSILLFAVAIALFWFTSRSAKTTTE